MTERERYLKVEQERRSLSTRTAGIPQEQAWLRSELAPLEEALTRAEILGETDKAGRLRAEAADKAGRLKDITEELEAAQKRIKVMGTILEDLRKKAEADMVPAAHKRFAKGVKNFVEKLQAARQAETDLSSLREEIKREFDEIGSLCPIETWETLIIRHLTDPKLKVIMGDYIDRMKAIGYEV